MIDGLIKILAVDDNPDNLITIKALIREAFPAAAVYTAQTGQAGYALAAQEDPHVILLDIVMPGMDGFALCRKLKADTRLYDTPIVFVTALKGDVESRIHALECGADAFLTKPIDESELIAQVRAMVKIKTANLEKHNEKQRLAQLVEDRTKELRKEHQKAIELVHALEAEKDYFEFVFNTSPDAAVISCKDTGVILNVNEGFTRLSGYSREEVIGKSSLALKLYQTPNDRHKLIRKLEEQGYCDGFELNFHCKNGKTKVCLLSAKMITLNGMERISCNIHDITDRKKMEDNLYHLSYHDYLTGLNNRRFFEQTVSRLDVKKVLPLSVIVADINGLKLINDAFGHISGDKLIAATAKTFQHCSRSGDTLARTGGDEFTMLMPNTDADTAANMQRTIQSAFAEYNRTQTNEAFQINVALGLDTKMEAVEPIDLTIKAAEKNMYQRKLLERKSTHSTLLSSIKATLFEKNEETQEHCERLVVLSRKIGRYLKLPQKEMDELEIVSMLHDIGKVGIPDHILMKQGKLSEDEWIEMKKHPEIGYRIASASPELAQIAEYILYHHERWDGKGYPQGLRGEQIPILSRIIAVVDSYDAMTHDRPYRKGMQQADVMAEMRKNAGLQFDPVLVDVFIGHILTGKQIEEPPPM